jgi:hypothetical protein
LSLESLKILSEISISYELPKLSLAACLKLESLFYLFYIKKYEYYYLKKTTETSIRPIIHLKVKIINRKYLDCIYKSFIEFITSKPNYSLIPILMKNNIIDTSYLIKKNQLKSVNFFLSNFFDDVATFYYSGEEFYIIESG